MDGWRKDTHCWQALPCVRDMYRSVNPHDPVEAAATTEGVPVAPGLSPSIANVSLPADRAIIDMRVVLISAMATF